MTSLSSIKSSSNVSTANIRRLQRKLRWRLLFFVSLSLITCGGVSLYTLDVYLTHQVQKQTLDAAALLSFQIRSELKNTSEVAKLLADTAFEDFKKSDHQTRFLQNNLKGHDSLLTVSLYEKGSKQKNDWKLVLRLSRPKEDRFYFNEKTLRELDVKYPLDLNSVRDSQGQVNIAHVGKSIGVLRMAVPYHHPKNQEGRYVLTIDVLQDQLTSVTTKALTPLSFIVNRQGKVLAQSRFDHFTLGEDISYLSLFKKAYTSDTLFGSMQYSETPNGPTQIASFHHTGYEDLVILSQIPKRSIYEIILMYLQQLGGVALVLFSLAFWLSRAKGLPLAESLRDASVALAAAAAIPQPPLAPVIAHSDEGVATPKKRKRSSTSRARAVTKKKPKEENEISEPAFAETPEPEIQEVSVHEVSAVDPISAQVTPIDALSEAENQAEIEKKAA